MTAMYSGTTAEPLRPFPPHERHPSDHLRSYAVPPRPMVDLPRPLEPRPTHQLLSSLSDASSSQRRQDGFRNPAPTPSEHRPQTQNLPRLHDILTSAPPAQSPTYSSGWSSTTGHPPQPNGDGYHSHTSWHPPLAPPHDSAQPYHLQPGRPVELPILQTSPTTRHDSHSAVPPSPYSGYPDSSRDYNATRRDHARRPSTTSYHQNGAPGPYTPGGPEEMHYRGPLAPLERPGSNNFPPPGPDSSKKYMGVRDIPGEGTYHVYEGGFRIPTQVDGETVNPAWGLTKANKPRKRLAMACLDCREKKIKCEPGPNSCLQCEKAKRPCRKAPIQAPAEQATTPVWQGNGGSPMRRSAGDTSNGYEQDADLANKRRTMEDASPSDIPTKKHRSTSPRSMTNGTLPHGGSVHQHTSPIVPISPGKVVSWEEDPYTVEPEMTRHLLENYFVHVNNAMYGMFPRHHFMWWLTSNGQKCHNERLVLYAMLAVGSLFADDRYSGFGKHCVNIVTEAVHARPGKFSMTLVQVRLLLGLYHFAKGANSTACDYVGAGINAATFLRYHTEQGCSEDEASVEKSRNEFAFSKDQLTECRRRTMWSGFLMDRYCGTTRSFISAQDIFIRLPCLDEVFERGLASKAPCHSNGIMDAEKCILTPSSEISPMGWLILLAAIWGDVANFVNRAVHLSPSVYEGEYERFYEHTRVALQSWMSYLPEHLQYSQANVERSIQGGYSGQFVLMHVLCHLSWLKLSRSAKHACISKSIARNVRACHRHAHELLQVMSTLRAAKLEAAERNAQEGTLSHIPPFTGYAILAAIDVVGAGGLDSNLRSTLDLISCGLECLRELGRYWNSARDQDKACEKRYYQIHNVLKHPFTARSGCWLGREWGVHSSLEREFALEDDCIYGVSDRDYFDALKDDAVTPARGGSSRVA